MIKNYRLVRKIENEFSRNNKISHIKALKIFEGMWKYALNLGVSFSADYGKEIQELVEFKKRINTGFSNKK